MPLTLQVSDKQLLTQPTDQILFDLATRLTDAKRSLRTSMVGRRTCDGVVREVSPHFVLFRGAGDTTQKLTLSDRRATQLLAADTTTRKNETGSCPPKTLTTRTQAPTGQS